MRMNLLLLLLPTKPVFSQITTETRVLDNKVYAVMNSFVKFQKIKALDQQINTFYYCSNDLPGKITDSAINSFFEEMRSIDTVQTFLSDADYNYFRHQIDHPCITKWEKGRIENVRVRKFAFAIPIASLPLFSTDHQSAVMVCSYYGMSRCYLFHFNASIKTWECVMELWQNGS